MEQKIVFVFTSGVAFGIGAVTLVRWTAAFLTRHYEKEELIDEMLEEFKKNDKV